MRIFAVNLNEIKRLCCNFRDKNDSSRAKTPSGNRAQGRI